MPEAASNNVVQFDPNRRRASAKKTASRPRPRTSVRPGPSIESAMESWELTLASRGRSEGTVRSYRDTVSLLASWLTYDCTCMDTEDPCPAAAAESTFPAARSIPGVEDITTGQIRLFLVHERRRTSEGNAHKHFRNLRAYFRWVCKQKYRTTPTPVDSDDAPNVPEQEFPPLLEAEIKKLMATCKGSTFADRRDLAIIWVLVDIGPRVEGLSNIRYTPEKPDSHDLKLTQYRVRIRLKGGDEYWAPLGKKAAVAVDRYIRMARDRHRYSDEDWLWLGERGHLTKTGIQLMLRRRGEEAGVDNVHPHRFRRTSATMFRDAGGSEEETMYNYGWKTGAMPRHYTKATAKERAKRAHSKYSPGDRF